jgi:ATP-dependent Lon protease
MNEEDWEPTEEDHDDLIGNIHQRTEELYRISGWEMNENGLITSPAILLDDVVVFPHMISPVFLIDEASIQAVEAAQIQNKTVIALYWSGADESGDDSGRFLPVGMEIAVGRILTYKVENIQPLCRDEDGLKLSQLNKLILIMWCRSNRLLKISE